MKSAFIKDIFREIGKSKSRFFSIFAIIALGAGFFAGLKTTSPDMLYTMERYFERQNLMDIHLVSTYGFNEKDLSAIESYEDTREVYPTYSKDVFVENNLGASVIAKIMSLPDGMNDVVLLEGRLPENPDECVVEKNGQMTVIHEIGDTVSVFTTDPDDPIEDSLERTSWKVVGIIMSPQYLAYDKGTASIGDGDLDTFVMIPEENFKFEVFTDVYLTLDSTNGVSPYDEAYSAAVDSSALDFEEIGENRSEERINEIKEEAYSEIDEAKEKIADAEKELSDAEKELADAFAELTDGEKEIKDGWNEYYKGIKDLEEGKAEFEKKIKDAESEITNGYIQIQQGRQELEAGKKEFEEGKEQFEILLKLVGLSVDELYSRKAKIEALIAEHEKYPATELVIATFKTELALLNSYISSHQQILDAEKQIRDAEASLNYGYQSLLEGEKELEENKKKAEKEFLDAEKKLSSAYSDLTKAEKEIAEGWEEYYKGLEEFEEGKAEAETELAKAKRDIAKAEDTLSDLKDPVWYVLKRSDSPGYSTYKSDAEIIDSVGRVFPIFFFLVAMLVCLTTMTRMVEEQRTQIGTMKALGYGKGSILLKYIAYSSFASVSGAVFGIALCVIVFPLIIFYAYGMRYVLPPLEMKMMPGLWIFIGVICILCTSLAVFMAGYSELRESPAELMRPKAPKAGKRVLLERIPFIWKRLSFTRKVTVRNLFRYKKRIFMTILGIAGCAALTLTGIGIYSSISVIFEKQYNEIYNYDLIVSLDTDSGEKAVNEVFEELDSNKLTEKNIPAYIMSAKYHELGSLNIVVASDKDAFEEMVLFRDINTGKIYDFTDDGVIITERMAIKYELSAGDEITFTSGDNEFTAKISAVAENYAMHFIYMSEDYYTELCGEKPVYNSTFMTLKDNSQKAHEEFAEVLMEYDGVLALSYASDAKESFSATVENLNYVVILIIVCAAALAFVVLYNLTNINITERIREIATIKVLGFYDKEVSAYVFRENIILSILGAFAGLGLGKLLHAFVMNTIQTDEVMFGNIIPLWAYATAFVMTIFFACAVNWIMYFRLKEISMVESLKSVE